MTRTFLKIYKKLGPVLIQIKQKNSTVISALGLNSYKFAHLPDFRENYNAILKLTLKAHFNDKIVDFDTLGNSKSEKKSFLSLLKTVFASPMLTSSSDSTLVNEIVKNYHEYSWEEIDDFYEIDRCGDIPNDFPLISIVQFTGFPYPALVKDKTVRPVPVLTSKDYAKEKEMSLLAALHLCFHYALNEIKDLEEILSEYLTVDQSLKLNLNYKIIFDCFDQIISDLKKFLNRLVYNFNSQKAGEDIEDQYHFDLISSKKCIPAVDSNSVLFKSRSSSKLHITLPDHIKSPDNCTNVSAETLADSSIPTLDTLPIKSYKDLFEINNYNLLKASITVNSFKIDDLYDIYLNNFEYFQDFLLFIEEYEANNERSVIDQNAYYVKILSKITDYQKIMKSLLCCYYTAKGKKCYDNFYSMAQAFNKESHNIELRKLSMNLKPYITKEAECKINYGSGNGVAKIAQELAYIDIKDICYFVLKDVLPCHLAGESFYIYLLLDRICILNSKFSCVDATVMKNTEIYLFCRKLYIISPIFNSSCFQVQEMGKCKSQMVSFDIFNKETTQEFINTFNCLKNDCSYSKKIFFREHCTLFDEKSHKQSNVQKDLLVNQYLKIKDQINACKTAKEPDFRKARVLQSQLKVFEENIISFCHDISKSNRNRPKEIISVSKIEDRESEYMIKNINNFDEKIVTCSQEEMQSLVYDELLRKNSNMMTQPVFFNKVVSILNTIDMSLLKTFSLDLYPEEETLLKRKNDILHRLVEALQDHSCVNKSKTSFVITKYYDIKKFLFQNDVLSRLATIEQKFYLNLYHSLLEDNNVLIAVLMNKNILEVATILSMLLQRNLYYFFDPVDLEKISKEHLEGKQGLPDSFKNYTRKNIKLIQNVLNSPYISNNYKEISNLIHSVFSLD